MSSRQARRRQQRVTQRKAKPTTPWYLNPMGLGIAVVVVAVVVVVIIELGQNNKKKDAHGAFTPKPVPTLVMSAVTNPSPSTLATVGSGGLDSPWVPISGNSLTSGGKPELLYIGAEYCPYCAAERWGLINALSRFGTISGLKLMKSSSTDVFPSTNTFTTRNMTYASKYLTFIGVEETNNISPGAAGAENLQTPTAAENTLVNQFDSGQYIPFIDLAGRASGALPGPGDAVDNALHVDGTYSAPLSWKEVATLATSSPKSAQAKTIYGNGNWITAGICKVTNNKPMSVCSAAPIPALETRLGGTGPKFKS